MKSNIEFYKFQLAYNPGHDILELCSVLCRSDLPQVKRNLISSITNQECTSDFTICQITEDVGS